MRAVADTSARTGIFDPRWLVKIEAIAAAWKGERTLDLTTLLLFLAAATVIAITPGSGRYVAARTLAGGRRESLASSVGTGLAPAKCFTTDPVCNRARNHPETGRVHRIPSTDEDVLCSPPPSEALGLFARLHRGHLRSCASGRIGAHFSPAEFHVGLAGSLDTGKG